MTKYSAHTLADSRWYRRASTSCSTIGDRRGFTCIRRKAVDRFEVGYSELLSLQPVRWNDVVLGRGKSWEEAFGRASGATTHAGTPDAVRP